jgi:hypothetical protein
MSTVNRPTSGLGLSGAIELRATSPAGGSASQPECRSADATAPSGAEGTSLPDQAGQRPHLGDELQAMIGRQLTAMYHEIVNEPVPDRFVRLLRELAKKDASDR